LKRAIGFEPNLLKILANCPGSAFSVDGFRHAAKIHVRLRHGNLPATAVLQVVKPIYTARVYACTSESND
jgi:hypothetical protein